MLNSSQIYSYPATFHHSSCSQLTEVCMLCHSVTTVSTSYHLQICGHHDFSSLLETHCNCLLMNPPDIITISIGCNLPIKRYATHNYFLTNQHRSTFVLDGDEKYSTKQRHLQKNL